MALPAWLAPHDTGALAWIIVAAYALAAVLSLAARSRTRDRRERRFWLIAALVLIALGLNKQLDLQTDLIDWARTLARSEGWYRERRIVQLAVFGGLALVAAAVLALLARLTRTARPAVRAARVGLVVLALFVLVRAASFHHVDRVLHTQLGGQRLHFWLELAGIVVIGLAAAAALAGRRRRR